ncbi:hypothetical protein, partial [Tabrizicola sp.]|uniref:hypothetical protein n=1 Tax=Tabrizicola sp. TaxID=2005166 RepID=UPI003F3FCD04
MGFFRKIALTLVLVVTSAQAFAATCPKGEDFVASCQIEGREKGVLLCIKDDQAVYRFGPLKGEPELTLQSPLADLTYLRGEQAGLVVGEAVTFQNEDTSYRVAFGYRDGIEPAPNAWHKTGTIDVIRKDETIEDL